MKVEPEVPLICEGRRAGCSIDRKKAAQMIVSHVAASVGGQWRTEPTRVTRAGRAGAELRTEPSLVNCSQMMEELEEDLNDDPEFTIANNDNYRHGSGPKIHLVHISSTHESKKKKSKTMHHSAVNAGA